MNAIQAFVPVQVVKTIAAFLDFCYIARRNVISEDSLTQLKLALNKFHEARKVFSGTVRADDPSAFSLPRQHAMVHYHDHIKNFGSPNGLCSSITESKHITAVKRPWRRSNKHMALPQILKVNERLDKLAAAQADFRTRGMLVDSCLVQAINDASSSEGSMDGDDGDSDETNSESSDDEIPIPDSYYTGIQNPNPHILNLDNDSNEEPANIYEHVLRLDSDHSQRPSQAPLDHEEDEDCGPVESGPLMNEVRLVARKGQSGCPHPGFTQAQLFFTAPTHQYPTSFTALGLKIGQHNLLDLTRRFLFYQLNPTSTVEPDQLTLAACPMLWEPRVTIYHSATATFRAPSNPSGPGGMYREVIRSTPLWPRGDLPGPRRDCVFVDMGDGEGVGMEGLLVARVFLFFRFSHNDVDYPCALVHWYSTSDEPDDSTGLWVVRPESTPQRARHMSVIHIDTIFRGAHLLPRFLSDAPIYREVNYMNSLDVFTSFYVNKHIDHHAFKVAF